MGKGSANSDAEGLLTAGRLGLDWFGWVLTVAIYITPPAGGKGVVVMQAHPENKPLPQETQNSQSGNWNTNEAHFQKQFFIGFQPDYVSRNQVCCGGLNWLRKAHLQARET
jgi:hypothetical protein